MPLLPELRLLRQEAGLANFQVTGHIIRWLSHVPAEPQTLCDQQTGTFMVHLHLHEMDMHR